MPRTDVAPVGTLSTELVRYLSGEPVPELASADEVRAQIVARILQAKTMEEVFDNEGTTATQKMVGATVVLRDIQLRPSSIDGAGGVYAVLQVELADKDGEVHTQVLNTGSPRIMAQACRAKDLGALPVAVTIVEVGRAKPGQSAPLGLELFAA